MKIVARINGENMAMAEILKQRGVNAKLVRGGVIVELLASKDSSFKFEIPDEVATATLFIDCSEHGGGMTNTGSGTVVCGLSGKALRPYYVPKGYSNAEHAFFSVPNAVVTIKGRRRDNNITIKEGRIAREGNLAWIEEKELWSGELETLPDIFVRFQAAAEAAYQKGNCYHCRCVHYAER